LLVIELATMVVGCLPTVTLLSYICHFSLLSSNCPIGVLGPEQ